MVVIITGILVLFGSMLFFSVKGFYRIEKMAIDNTGAIMLDDQKAKVQVATHAMALTIGHAIENIYDKTERNKKIQSLVG